MEENDTTKEETFFYHSDHLGSTSYITDDKANITQYDAYLPYGELLVDEHSSSEDLPYKFNGKQFDEETGLYYYGARYMNPIASIWYGVDPLVEKHPFVNSNNFCYFNPLKIIDPIGEDTVNLLPPAHKDFRTSVLKMDYKHMKTDSKIINVWGHGSPEGIEYNGRIIDTADSFDKMLKSHSSVWNRRKQGENTIIVLHSCSTADFAQELSKDKRFKNVLIVAPNKNIQVHYKEGKKIGKDNRYRLAYYGYTTVSNTNIRTGKTEMGQWLGYKNGVLYNNYAGDSKPQPGSQGFEYRTLKDRFLSIFKK